MIDQSTRMAVLRLKKQEHGTRTIARVLKISRGAVRRILERQSAVVPAIQREEKAERYREDIIALYKSCRGNLVRVHEELVAQGAELSYQALTHFCRKHEIGKKPRLPGGHYDFKPGQEMQHDTSPHLADIGGKLTKVQTASIVLCFCRVLFFQFYITFNRYYCKLFLTDGLQYVDGSCSDCMIDNTSVVVLKGSGKDMVPVPEMEAFAERFDFTFKAHEIGHANRSARVEAPMYFIEHNFLAGRKFKDFDDLNRQAVEFCDRHNAKIKRRLKASPMQLYALEKSYLSPLPIFIPEVYNLHHRFVDVEGYVHVASHRYSAPWKLIGRRLEVRETKHKIELYDGARLVASHRHAQSPVPTRILLPEHRPPRGQGVWVKKISKEEKQLRDAGEPIATYTKELKRRGKGRTTTALRRLLSLMQDYPRNPFVEAVMTASQFGLYDLERLERLILRNIAAEFFILSKRRVDDE